MNRIKLGLFLVVVICSFMLAGCSDKKIDLEQIRIEKLAAMREGMTGFLVFAAMIVVGGGLLAAPALEKLRASTAGYFKLSIDTQINMAYTVYFTVAAVVAIFSIADPGLSLIFPAVMILLAGSFYPFLVHYVPGLKNSDLMRRKAAMNQIKTFMMMILVMYVLMNILTPDGFAGIALK